MAWIFHYNGVGTSPASTAAHLIHLTVSDYAETPVYDETGAVLMGVERKVSGHALMVGDNSLGIDEKIADLTDWNLPGQAMVFGIDGGSLIELDEGDSDIRGYPKVEYSVNKITGENSAFVTFTATARASAVSNACPYTSHHWKQEWTVAASGALGWSINGVLTGNFGAADIGDPAEPNNIDFYRCLVLPTLPPGFRVDSMVFGVSDYNMRLEYAITATEHARGLPKPATTGSGSFRWRRDLHGDFLGKKHFEAELEGPPGVAREELLAVLVQVAGKRIRFGGDYADLIEELEVTEGDIFSANKIGLRIAARGVGNTAVPADRLNSGSAAQATQFILADLMDGLPAYEAPLAYGYQAICSAIQGRFSCDDPGKAEYREVPDFCVNDAPGFGDAGTNGTVPTPPQPSTTLDEATAYHSKYPIVGIEISETLEIDEKITVLAWGSGYETPHQFERPTARLRTIVKITRQGKAPERVMAKRPKHTVIESQSFAITSGKTDANETRRFTGVFERVVRFLNQPGTVWQSFETDATLQIAPNQPIQTTLVRAIRPAAAQFMAVPLSLQIADKTVIEANTVFNLATLGDSWQIALNWETSLIAD